MESKNSKEIIIRKATWEDHEDISRILQSAFETKSGSTRRWWNILSDHNVFPHVVVVDGFIMGTATLYILEKLIHTGGKVGIIEDVAIHENSRGLGIGKKIIDHLVEHAKTNNCYKVILSCSKENVGFYEKCGFYNHEITMRKDLFDK